MKTKISNNREDALAFCEGGRRSSQRVAYWEEGGQIYKFERLPGEANPTWQEGVGGQWWSATKTVEQKMRGGNK